LAEAAVAAAVLDAHHEQVVVVGDNRIGRNRRAEFAAAGVRLRVELFTPFIHAVSESSSAPIESCSGLPSIHRFGSRTAQRYQPTPS
jgi:hypothetical protein